MITAFNNATPSNYFTFHSWSEATFWFFRHYTPEEFTSLDITFIEE